MGIIISYSQIKNKLGEKLSGMSEGNVIAFDPTSKLRKFVYKEYKARTGDNNRFQCLYDLVSFTNSLSPKSREILRYYCALPLRLVVDDTTRSQLLGVIMSRFSGNYLCKGPITNGMDAKLDLYLCKNNKVKNDYGLRPLTQEDRKRIAVRCASFINFLHKNGFVYGDLSFNNILIHLARHTPLFIDCDGIASMRRGIGYMRQGHTGDWLPPEGFVPCTTQTDSYKLALLITRLFDVSEYPRQARIWSTSAEAGITSAFGKDALKIIHQAGNEKPDERPTAEEIFSAIYKK